MSQLEAMKSASSSRAEPLELVWIDCPYPVVATGLKSALEGRARVHLGPSAPVDDVPSAALAAVPCRNQTREVAWCQVSLRSFFARSGFFEVC